MGLRVTIQSSEWEEEKQFALGFPKRAKGRMWRSIRAISLQVERNVKIKMPVDTGRARASWGHWTPMDLNSIEAGASQSDAVWEEDEDELAITQGSNVEYVGVLNEGHSQQAPAGFIDAEAARVLQQLADELGTDFVREFNE